MKTVNKYQINLHVFTSILTILVMLLSSPLQALAGDGTVSPKDDFAEPAPVDGDHEESIFSKHFRQIPTDYESNLKNLLSYDWRPYTAVVATTLALMPYDQTIVDSSHDYAVRYNILKRGSPYGSLGGFRLMGKTIDFHYPKDMLSLFWYAGDGLFSLQLIAGFATYGYFANSSRGATTAAQIFSSLVITASMVIPIKMITGRESPLRSTTDGGRWQGFPGLSTYINQQARYYAFPSGHVATAVSTLTVIAENYVDLPWIVPIGCVTVGLLMFSLMNVGSHWPSDYPLAIMIGYTAAHTVVSNHKERQRANLGADNSVKRGMQWQGVTPACTGAYCGLSTQWQF